MLTNIALFDQRCPPLLLYYCYWYIKLHDYRSILVMVINQMIHCTTTTFIVVFKIHSSLSSSSRGVRHTISSPRGVVIVLQCPLC